MIKKFSSRETTNHISACCELDSHVALTSNYQLMQIDFKEK